jgi:hypothetical protein
MGEGGQLNSIGNLSFSISQRTEINREFTLRGEIYFYSAVADEGFIIG